MCAQVEKRDDTINSRVKILEKQKSELEEELRSLKRRPEGNIGYVLLIIGLLLLSVAIYYSNNISALIGIALIFWGGLFFYIRPIQFIRKDILDASIIESQNFQQKILNELGYNGIPMYVSPGSSVAGLRIVKVYIIPQNGSSIKPSYDGLSEEEKIISNSTVSFTPPGHILHRLIEEELKTNFSIVEMEHLPFNLRKSIVEGLELSENFDMEITNTKIYVNMKGNIFTEAIIALGENRKIGDPLTSALACILARVTRQQITIEKLEADLEEQSTKIEFGLENI
jgi:hypothetical protein